MLGTHKGWLLLCAICVFALAFALMGTASADKCEVSKKASGSESVLAGVDSTTAMNADDDEEAEEEEAEEEEEEVEEEKAEEPAEPTGKIPQEIIDRWPAPYAGQDAKDVVEKFKTKELYGTIINLNTGKVVTFKEMIEATKDIPLVFVGEKHDNMDHHVLQADVFEGMYAYNHKLSLGMEMFWKVYNKALQDYVDGEIDEETMLEQSHYAETWGFDYKFFKRQLNFAAKHNCPIIGLNIPKPIMQKLVRNQELTPREKALMPKEVDTSNKEHRKHVMAMFTGMFEALKTRAPELLKEGFEDRFYYGQCVWDEVFAEGAAEYLDKAPKGTQMIFYVGGGHIEKRHNIPERFVRRTKKKYLSIYPFGLMSRKGTNWEELLNKKTADFLVITAP